jgi:hypothetical protein
MRARPLLVTAVLALTLASAAACGGNTTDMVPATAASSTPSAVESSSSAPASESASVSPSPSEDSTGRIAVSTPAAGATVERTFTVTGTSVSYEGTLVWQLLRGDTVVKRGIGQGGAAAKAPFRFTVTAPAPGTYTLRVSDAPAKDGAAVTTAERTVSVS